MIDVWNWFLWSGNEIRVLPQVFLETSTLYAVTAEVTELNKRKKSEKDVVYFQPEENHKTRIAKSEKVLNITGSNTSWKLVFFLIFYAKQKRLKHQGKTVRQSVIPGNFKRRYRRSPYDSGVLLYWVAVLTCKHFNRPVMSQREVVYHRFLQFLAHFPKPKLQVTLNRI